jgi:uncharacterized protein YxjI
MAKGFHLALKNALKLNDVYGESAVTCNKRNSIRPTLDVNGIGGYIVKVKQSLQVKHLLKSLCA